MLPPPAVAEQHESGLFLIFSRYLLHARNRNTEAQIKPGYSLIYSYNSIDYELIPVERPDWLSTIAKLGRNLRGKPSGPRSHRKGLWNTIEQGACWILKLFTNKHLRYSLNTRTRCTCRAWSRTSGWRRRTRDRSDSARHRSAAEQPGVSRQSSSGFSRGEAHRCTRSRRSGVPPRCDPRAPQFAVGAADCLAMQGSLAQAERELRNLTQRYPGYALAWYNLG